MSEYDKEPLSRVEEILDETSSGTEYDKEPLSRVELRLKEVMAKIDELVPDATVYKAGGSVTFANLPSPSKSTLGYVYDVSDAFTTTADFKEGSGKKYPAGTNVAIVDVGTDENPVYKYDVLSGFIDMDNYVEKEAGKGLSTNDFTDAAKNKLDELENYDDTEIKSDISALSDTVADKVDKVTGKGLSTNDYTDADKALVQDSPITVTATGSDLTLSTSSGSVNALTVFGKSEVVDGAIKSAGEGWSVVRLADLTWSIYSQSTTGIDGSKAFIHTLDNPAKSVSSGSTIFPAISNYKLDSFYNTVTFAEGSAGSNAICQNNNGTAILIRVATINTLTDLQTYLSNNPISLAYQLADPTQGNTIAVKTDNNTGIDGTMATFTTGTPLYGVSDTVRDVMTWDGSTGTVTKKCAEVDLGTLTWGYSSTSATPFFQTELSPINCKANSINMLCPLYTPQNGFWHTPNNNMKIASGGGYLNISNFAYTNSTDFKTAMSGVKLIYELATPITETLTQTENDSIAGLRTYTPTTHAQNNAGATMTIEAYANTANGKAMLELEKKILTDYEPKVISLTQAEYDALETYEEDVFYNITDADPSGITVDGSLSDTSVNPVQNKVITTSINSILSEAEIQAQINDCIYQGADLTVKFASEIVASPYRGDPWAWIKARITAGDFTGIHVGDYIPFTTTNSVTLNAQIAGINTYKNYGDSAVGNHIDFICKELWPTPRPVNKVNYNNGTSAQSRPWLASDLYLYLNSLSGDVPNGTSLNPETVAVDYTADGVYYFLPTQLKNVIIEKNFLLPTRYSASGLLSDDNSWAWKNIGKLWLPDECEVYGMPVWGGKGGYSLGGSALQYPLFAGNMNRLKFRNGRRYHWWLLSPYSGDSTYWCAVNLHGDCDYYSASYSSTAAPVCFRVG